MTEDELITIVTRKMKDLASEFDDDDYADAVDDAERDCGWSLPQSTAFKIKWLKNRTKRHLFFLLLTGKYAKGFQYESVHLDNRFNHFQSLVEKMDKDFEDAIEKNAAEFADVSATHMFGTKVDAGFQYGPFGEDLTYSESNAVIFNPDESDD